MKQKKRIIYCSRTNDQLKNVQREFAKTVYSKEFITNENGDIVKNGLVKSVGYLLSKKSIGDDEKNCSCFQNKEETDKFF